MGKIILDIAIAAARRGLKLPFLHALIFGITMRHIA